MRFLRLFAALSVAAPVFAQSAQPAANPVEISGLFFGSFNMRIDSASKAGLGGERPNAFSIDRIYLKATPTTRGFERRSAAVISSFFW